LSDSVRVRSQRVRAFGIGALALLSIAAFMAMVGLAAT